MKLFVISLVIFLNQYSISLAQQTKPALLVFVDTFVTDLNYLILDPGKIASLDVLKDSAATKLYGPGAKNGVVIIRTKEKIDFLRLNSLFDKYEVADSVRKFRVCIDEIFVKRPELILADPAEIASISTINITNWDVITSPVSEMVVNIGRRHKNPGKQNSTN